MGEDLVVLNAEVMSTEQLPPVVARDALGERPRGF